MNVFLKATLVLSNSDAELGLALLWEMDTLGVIESQHEAATEYQAFFSPDCPHFCSELASRLSNRGIRPQKLECNAIEVSPEDWLSRWKESFTGFAVGEDFYIHPPWESPAAEVRVNICIEPSHGFGTGTHESTQLALEAIATTIEEFGTFLDVGTGSGILAVAAAKLRPDLEITVLEIDSLALECALENFKINGIEGIASVLGGPESLNGPFDVVVANLTLGVFRSCAEDLLRLTGRRLIVSGLTEEQEAATRELFSSGDLRVAGVWRRNEWVALRFDRDQEC